MAIDSRFSGGGDATSLADLRDRADSVGKSLAQNLSELRIRTRPRNLMREAEEMLWVEVDRMTDSLMDTAEEVAADCFDFVRDHRSSLFFGLFGAAAVATTLWFATRKKTVPLSAAYGMEDPYMMEDRDEALAGGVDAAVGKVRERLRDVGEKAREKVGRLSSEAKEQFADVAEFAAAAAKDAAEAAREAATSAREAAGEAGRWAKRQPQENPLAVVLVAFAAGALVGALLPGRRGRDA